MNQSIQIKTNSTIEITTSRKRIAHNTPTMIKCTTSTCTRPTLIGLLSLLYHFILIKTALSRPSQSPPNASTSRNVPNRYVQSSPPCVAAVCKDGIAVIALHTNIQSEPLFSDKADDSSSSSSSSSSIFPDIPLISRNPLRIERLDDRGSVLVTCGWRADGMMLADVGRELCSDELMRYGGRQSQNQSTSTSTSTSTSCTAGVREYYGKWLGWGLVKHLVKCEAKSSVRRYIHCLYSHLCLYMHLCTNEPLTDKTSHWFASVFLYIYIFFFSFSM